MARKSPKSGKKAGARDTAGADDGVDRLPSKEDVLTFIRESSQKVGKREIARAFNIKGGARIALKRLIAELTDEGALSGNRRELLPKSGLPPVCVLDVIGRDDDGDLIAEPTVWEGEGERPKVLLTIAHGRQSPHEAEIGVGDRVLARVTMLEDRTSKGSASRDSRSSAYRVKSAGCWDLPRLKGDGGTIEPIDRKELRSWSVERGDEGSAKDGDLVRFDLPRRAVSTCRARGSSRRSEILTISVRSA